MISSVLTVERLQDKSIRGVIQMEATYIFAKSVDAKIMSMTIFIIIVEDIGILMNSGIQVNLLRAVSDI